MVDPIKEPVKETARRLGLDEELVHKVISNFWKAVKYHISNAHLAREGILINGYFKIKLRIKLVYRFVYKYNEYVGKMKYKLQDPEYWRQIIAKLKTYGNDKYIRKVKKDN